ncbi:MAG TPA: xanthine dehydrogenase family protein subunit M [Pseudolabrys sp.]|nr:xanthine dehydrogenase family protein subunit M [Pseudolabrys sp.]
MKPAPFEYRRAESIEHACAVLADAGDDARVLAGGQSLIPMMNLRLARPSMLVDIGRLALGSVSVSGQEIRVGALVRHRQLLEDVALRNVAPVFAEAARFIAHPTIRNFGTAGGSVAHADPTAEIPSLLMLFDGKVEAASNKGTRTISANALFKGAFSTSLAPTEMIVALRFRLPAAAWGGCFLELAERDGDFAIASVCAVVERKGETITGARVVLGGADSVPVRPEIGAALNGRVMTEAAARDVSRAVAEAQKSYDDIRASAAYRRHLLAELVQRALLTAYARAEKR